MTRRTRSAVIRVGVVLTLDKDEAPVAAVFPVLGEDGVGRRAGTGEGIEDDGVGVGGQEDHPLDQLERLGREVR